MSMSGAERQRRYMERKRKAAFLATPSKLIEAFQTLSAADRATFCRELLARAEWKEAVAANSQVPAPASPDGAACEPVVRVLDELVGGRIAAIVRDRRASYLALQDSWCQTNTEFKRVYRTGVT
jgi:hypothetical protein